MNKQQFYHWLENPHLLNGDTLQPLTEVVQAYPFFQAARMLLIKNLHNLEHIRFNGELKTCAAHIANRRQLFELVYKSKSNPVVAALSVDSQGEQPSIKSGSLVAEDSTTDTSSVPQVDSEPHGIPQERLTGVLSSVSESDSDHGSQPLVVDDYFEVTDEIPSFEVAKNTPSKPVRKVEDAILLPSADLLGYDLPQRAAYLLEKELPPIDLTEDESYSFSDWLNYMRHRKVVAAPEPARQSAKGLDLIDNFLNQDTFRIIPKPIETAAKIEDKVKQSVSENEDLLTETLASIYIKQKHFHKAINIFEKLRLKYPEKNTYFAARISELEKLSKTQ